jgi:hypothetical protein
MGRRRAPWRSLVSPSLCLSGAPLFGFAPPAARGLDKAARCGRHKGRPDKPAARPCPGAGVPSLSGRGRAARRAERAGAGRGQGVAGLYPGAAYERSLMALELLAAAVDVWVPAAAAHPDPALKDLRPDPAEDAAARAGLYGPGVCVSALGALVNSFDLVRRAAFELLLRFPAPLPAFDSEEAVAGLLRWSAALVDSPRARESDSGALLLQAPPVPAPVPPRPTPSKPLFAWLPRSRGFVGVVVVAWLQASLVWSWWRGFRLRWCGRGGVASGFIGVVVVVWLQASVVWSVAWLQASLVWSWWRGFRLRWCGCGSLVAWLQALRFAYAAAAPRPHSRVCAGRGPATRHTRGTRGAAMLVVCAPRGC